MFPSVVYPFTYAYVSPASSCPQQDEKYDMPQSSTPSVSSVSSSDDSRDFSSAQCIICQEIYVLPITLPCGHTCCYECLVQSILGGYTDNKMTTPSENDIWRDAFFNRPSSRAFGALSSECAAKCSQCRAACEIRVGDLKVDVALQKVLQDFVLPLLPSCMSSEYKMRRERAIALRAQVEASVQAEKVEYKNPHKNEMQSGMDDFETALPLVWPFSFPMETALPQDMDLTLRLLTQGASNNQNQSMNAYWVAPPQPQAQAQRQQAWM